MELNSDLPVLSSLTLLSSSASHTPPSTVTWPREKGCWTVLVAMPTMAASLAVSMTEMAALCDVVGEYERRNCKIGVVMQDVEQVTGWVMQDVLALQGKGGNVLPFTVMVDNKNLDAIKALKLVDVKSGEVMRGVLVFSPDRKLKLSMVYPSGTGRNWNEVLRAVDSLQLTAVKRVVTPASWTSGEDCIVASTVGQDEAHKVFQHGVITVPLPSNKPYLRLTADPRGGGSGHTTSASTKKPLVVFFMSSKFDQAHAEKIAKEIHTFGVEYEMRVCSSIKASGRLMELLNRYERMDRPKVYIACSGRNNSLGGLMDANVVAPIISCPPYSDHFAGADTLSSLRMPTGVAAMVVLDPQNAALAAIKILAMSDTALAQKIRHQQAENTSLLHVQDCDVKSSTYVPKIFLGLAQTFDATNLVLPPKGNATSVMKYVGKVRDRYNDGKNVILVTTDRLTAFDRPLAKIPFKGAVLNLVSKWWFEETAHIIPNHVLSVPHPNVTIGVAATPFPIEFVVRGYITGSSGTSMWTHYQNGVRDYCGVRLPEGLVQHQKLWKNLITPTTKSDEHDELISPKQIVEKGFMTQEEWNYCSKKALELFDFAQAVALKHGLILVDTKMEMGRAPNGDIILIDEIFTPDSSRYWIASSYDLAMQQGKSPQNIDKEFVRLWFKDHCDPYKDEVLPEAPKDIIAELSRRYIMLYELITGLDFPFPVSSDVNKSVQMALDQLEV